MSDRAHSEVLGAILLHNARKVLYLLSSITIIYIRAIHTSNVH